MRSTPSSLPMPRRGSCPSRDESIVDRTADQSVGEDLEGPVLAARAARFGAWIAPACTWCRHRVNSDLSSAHCEQSETRAVR